MSKQIVSFLVRTSSGTIDHEASLEKFKASLEQYEKDSSVDSDCLSDVINEIFDNPLNKGNAITKFPQFLLSKVGARVELTPGNSQYWEKAIASTLEAMTGEYGEPHAVLGTVKGAGGGTFRWSDASQDRIKGSMERVKKAEKAAKEAAKAEK
jgi:hypothetical protein